MAALLNSVLDLTKMEAGMVSYNFEKKNIAPLIEQVLSENAPNVKGKGLVLERQIPSDLPSVKMDQERILDVLRNLVDNAIKFTPEKGRITVSVHPIDDGLEVSVCDTGIGIPHENLMVVFEKFTSFDQKKGTGLGLAIVKHIVAAHGGSVWAESKVGEGSCFYFTLGRE